MTSAKPILSALCLCMTTKQRNTTGACRQPLLTPGKADDKAPAETDVNNSDFEGPTPLLPVHSAQSSASRRTASVDGNMPSLDGSPHLRLHVPSTSGAAQQGRSSVALAPPAEVVCTPGQEAAPQEVFALPNDTLSTILSSGMMCDEPMAISTLSDGSILLPVPQHIIKFESWESLRNAAAGAMQLNSLPVTVASPETPALQLMQRPGQRSMAQVQPSTFPSPLAACSDV